MNPVKLLQKGFLILAVVLCPVQAIQTAQEPDPANVAKQKAAAANDKAESREDRRAALVTLEEATRVFVSLGESVEAARALNRVGRLQLDLNEPKKAIESHKWALRLLKQHSSNEVEVDNLNGLALVHMRLTELEPAETALRLAISLSQESAYKAGEAEALLTLSDRQNYDNHVVALNTARKALSISETIGDKVGVANAYIQIGQYYMAQQMLSESKQSYETALEMCRDLRNTKGQADALIGLGFIEWRKGDWQAAISYLTQARGLVDDGDEPLKMGQISMGMGESLYEIGMPEIALSHFQRGLDYYRQGQRPDFVAYAIWQIGCTHYLLGNYSEAIKQLELSLSSVPRNSIQAAQSHESLARVYLTLTNYDLALEHLEAALPIYTRTVNPKEAAQALGLVGKVREQQGEMEQARKYYQQALDIFARLTDRVNLAVIYFALGRLELKLGDLNAAESFLRQSLDVTENMRRVSTSHDLTVAFSATVHERYESYVDCLMRKHKAQPEQGFDVRAFETNEQSRGRALVELLQATQTVFAPGLDSHLAVQEKSLRQSLRVKEDSKIALLESDYKKEDLAAVESDIAQLETQYKQVLDTILAHYPSFEQITRPTSWDVRQIQENVVADDETLLLEYSLGADRSYVWAVTRDRITSHELPSQNIINEAAQKVYKLLATRPSATLDKDLDQASQELSQLVLLPVATDLNKRRILIVADGALNYVPFQVLPAPSVDRKQLIVPHEIINAPSASILGRMRQEMVRRQPARNTLAAFGDPIFASNYAQLKDTKSNEQIAYVQTSDNDRLREALRDVKLNGDSFNPSAIPPLFYAKKELANLRQVAGGETLLATGFDASRETLLRTDLTNYAVLHFATHGILDPKRPENSGLLLSMVNPDGSAQQGFVGLNDIYSLHAPVDLVVLSACQTGLGKDVRGEGLIGLTRGFMYAGASSVVASLWKVDDEATAELMKRFYSNMLEKGMTPSAALGAAQNSIRQQPEWSSPYYWAAFTLQGDYRHVLKSPYLSIAMKYQQAIAGGFLLALLAGSIWWYRRSSVMRAF